MTHTIIRNLSEMCGSKYVQSDLNDVYSEIKTLVKQRNQCLFVGTPCQVYGIQKAIKFSPLLITKDHVSIMLFRDKSFGYSTANVRVQFENGRKLEQRYYAKVFLKHFLMAITFVHPILL